MRKRETDTCQQRLTAVALIRAVGAVADSVAARASLHTLAVITAELRRRATNRYSKTSTKRHIDAAHQSRIANNKAD